MRVLISGASIAGPALAYWLGRHGFQPTVVERAPELRTGGSAVDFRGQTHHTVLTKMGVLDRLKAVQTGGTPMRFVDAQGATRLLLPAEFTGGDIEVPRYDLSRVMVQASGDTTRYRFNDSIAALAQTAGGVDVTLASGIQETFELVIGADGIHSNVRALAMGDERDFVHHLGYYVATWDAPNILGVDRGTVLHSEPGRVIGLSADSTDPSAGSGFAIFASPPLDYDRHDVSVQKGILANALEGLGWEGPKLVSTLDGARELYFDSISRADVPSWSRGRVALVGDAGYGATIGGMGTGTALVGAYILAGELSQCDGDHESAFRRYESLMRPYAQKCQQGGDRTGRFFAPRTALGLTMRDRILSRRFAMNLMLKAGQNQAELELPAYPT